MVALVDGQPKLLVAQGDARGVPAPPPRGRHAPHDLRSAQGARARAHPRRPGGRAREHRRGDRADQDLADAGRSAGRRCCARTGSRAPCRRCWRAPATSATRPEDLAEEFGLRGRRLPAVRRPGAGDPRHAPAPPDRASSRTRSSANTASCSTTIQDLIEILAQPGRAAGGDPRPSSTRSASSTATSAAPRSSQRPRRPHDRGPDRAERRRGHAVARRLREVAAGRATTRRSAAAAAARAAATRQGRGLHRPAVRREHARHAAVLLQPRQGVLAEGVPAAAGGPRLARPADREPAAAGGGRADQRGAAGQASSRTTSSCSSPRASGTVKKTPLDAFARPRTSRHHRASSCDDDDRLVGVAHHRRHSATSCCSRARGKAIRFYGSRTCGRWAATRPACAA